MGVFEDFLVHRLGLQPVDAAVFFAIVAALAVYIRGLKFEMNFEKSLAWWCLRFSIEGRLRRVHVPDGYDGPDRRGSKAVK